MTESMLIEALEGAKELFAEMKRLANELAAAKEENEALKRENEYLRRRLNSEFDLCCRLEEQVQLLRGTNADDTMEVKL